MVQNSDSHQNHKSSSVNVPVAKSLSLNTLKDPNQDTNHELSKLIQNHSTPNIPTEDLISEEENLANELRAHRRSSSVKIIRMIRNGVFVPRFLETLIEEYPEYENVIENIKTYNIDVKVILAAISSGKFDTKDVLKVLSTNVKSQADFAFGALQMASKDAFTDFMENKGFKIHSNHSRQSSHDSAGQVTSVDSVERKKSKDKFLLEDRSLSQSSNKGNSLSQVLNSSNTKTQLLNSSNTKSQLLNASNAAQLLNISGNNRSADIIGSDSPKILKKALEPPKATRLDTSVQHVINEGPLEVGSNNPPQKRLDSRSRIIPEPEHSEYDPITHLMISKKSQTPPVESIRNSTIRNSAIRSSISKPKSNPDESESDFVKTSIKKYDSEGNLRGSIVHFVPSAQLKILKDVSKSDAVKPIFLRQLLQSNNSSYPNFRVEDVNVEKEIPFTRKKEARFNEKIDGLLLDKGNSSQVQKNRLDKSVFKRPPRPTSPITPENYLKTRGMNVSFDKKIVKKQGSNLYMGRVFAQNKIEVGSGSRMNLRQSFLVGKKMAVQDYGVDLDDDD